MRILVWIPLFTSYTGISKTHCTPAYAKQKIMKIFTWRPYRTCHLCSIYSQTLQGKKEFRLQYQSAASRPSCLFLTVGTDATTSPLITRTDIHATVRRDYSINHEFGRDVVYPHYHARKRAPVVSRRVLNFETVRTTSGFDSRDPDIHSKKKSTGLDAVSSWLPTYFL